MSLLSEGNLLWVGLQDDGLVIKEGERFRKFNKNTNPSFPGEAVWCIYKDSNGLHWLGTRDNGLVLFDPNVGVVKQYKMETSNITSNNIRSITEGRTGELWIGTEDNGLNRFVVDEEVFVPYSNQEIQNIKTLYFNNDVLWIGTNGYGLRAFDIKNERFYSYSTTNGLPNNVIYAIIPDSENNLWLSSNRGITKFSIQELGTSPTLVNYDNYDGLQALEFNTGASYKDKDGTLYFGGLNGINWFKPKELSSNPVPPKTVISSFEIFGNERPMSKNLKLNYKDNTITFNFAALHFSQPERNEFKYRLSDYDQEWSKPNTNNFARYTNLPSGDYTFEVLTSNYDGVWDDKPAKYSFAILPPWYFSLWAKLAYILATILAIFLVYKYLKWRWQMQVRFQMEHRETERLKKLDELKSKLYTNISHEFRTPLTLISGPVQELLAVSNIDKKDKKNLGIIEASSQRMLRLVNQLLDLSKLETGAVSLQVAEHELNPQISQIIEAFAHQANEKGIVINTKVDAFSGAWYDKDILEKIIYNLLSNAIKYAPENSKVEFSAISDSGNLVINVQNENEEISEKNMNKLFDRFYQIDKTSEGVGVGLSLIKELVTLTNGKISVSKPLPDLISFYVSMPIQKDKYNANTIESKRIEYDFVQNTASEIFTSETDETPQLLIVEDNKEVRSYMVSIFSEGYKVFEAKDGLEGIKLAIEYVPDLIISDIMMPVKDGIELCNTLKNDTRTSHIPIILLTAKTGNLNELAGLQNKADDYITKPFNTEILKQKVENTIAFRRELQNRYSQNVYLRPKDIAITSVDEEFLEKVQVLIDSKFSEPDFSVDEFTKELALSRMQLHRKLKALTGLSTTEFIRSQRLKSAVQLIESSDLTVSEIAYTIGFSNPSYFAKCFKEEYNCSPSEYANR